MNKKIYKISLIIVLSTFTLLGTWKLLELSKRKSLLENELSNAEIDISSQLNRINLAAKDKVLFLKTLAVQNQWSLTSVNGELNYLVNGIPLIKDEFVLWEKSISKVSQFFSERILNALEESNPKNSKTKNFPLWIRNLELEDKKFEDLRVKYENSIYKRKKLISKYEQLPSFLRKRKIEVYPSSSLYQEMILRAEKKN